MVKTSTFLTHYSIRRHHPIIWLVLIMLVGSIGAAEDETTIDWDQTTCHFVTAGGYARVKKLSNGELILVYSAGKIVYTRFSTDNGEQWSAADTVAQMEGYNCTNAELFELHNGWLIYGWNGRPVSEGVNPYTIHVALSQDTGRSWSEPILVFAAGSTRETGCWEPAFQQLPDGELQVYFANEAPYTANNDQEISLLRSNDSGYTWTGLSTVCYRAGNRDGMPVPVLLAGGRGIAVAIEDNGLSGLFKPVIVHTSLQDNWRQGPVSGDDARRWSALRQDCALEATDYAGAPYLVQMPGGETVLSVQSTRGRTIGSPAHIYAVMQVYCGDSTAHDFANPTIPFPDIPSTGNGLWSSLTVIDDSTVMAVSTINGLGTNGIWTVKGHVKRSTTQVRTRASVKGSTAAPGSIFLSSTSGLLTVTLNASDPFEVLLMDVQGRVVRSVHNGTGGRAFVAADRLPGGIYVVAVKGRGSLLYHRTHVLP